MGSGSGFTNASWGGGGSPDLSGAFRGGGAGIGHLFSAADREKNIRSYAASIGISPDVAMAVAKSEGFGRFDGDRGTSFGDLQMHIGGGLGDLFRRRTGKNPADPHNELELDRFALDQAKSGGWAPWHGAARIGVHGRYGIGSAPTVDGRRKVSPPGAPASGGHDIEAAVHSALGRIAMNVNLTYDAGHQKTVAKFVTKHQAVASRFPTDMGGPDTHGHYVSPGTPHHGCGLMSAREQSDVEVLVRALVKTMDRVSKRRPMEPTKMLGALGAVGAFVAAKVVPECDETADTFAMGLIGMGFVETLPTIRKAGAN